MAQEATPIEIPVRLRLPEETAELRRIMEAGWADQLAVLRAAGTPLNAAGDGGEGAAAGGEGEGAAGEGGEGEGAGGADAPQTFDRDYVEKLRKENAAARKRAQEAEARAKEYEDRDKTDQEKLAEQAQTATERATAAETRLLRYEVAADKGLPPKWAERLKGSTKTELAKDADELLAELGDQTPSFDGGPRGGPTPPRTIDQQIRAAAGRG